MTITDELIQKQAQEVFDIMAQRVTEEQLQQIVAAFVLAKQAHSEQRRKTGEPYIIHPIAVAKIAAEELKLGAHEVMAAFLHDVVEDTDYTVDDMRRFFGDDVAFLVDVVTKKKKKEYRHSKQIDNYQQLLDSFSYDIRALMIKLSDRLHNMRTLSSMRPDKQMKIAGETDYFYAPLANRLGLYDVKTDLENLSFKYRCTAEYNDILSDIMTDQQLQEGRLRTFTYMVKHLLQGAGIQGDAEVVWRKPYSLWRKMKASGKDFRHLDNHYYVRVTYTQTEKQMTEKEVCLKIYSLLTDFYKEKPQSFSNLIDSPKENSYQCLQLMLLSQEGVWEEVHICSQRMLDESRLGCMAGVGENNISEWIEKFRGVLKDIAQQSHDGGFIEKVMTTLYYDDVMVFTPDGEAIILPKGSTAIDFAFELHTEIGLHAKYARINGKLCSIKTELKRGDCIEIGTNNGRAPISTAPITPKADWHDFAHTYKARRELNHLFAEKKKISTYIRCPHCLPLPGGDIIGIKDKNGLVMIHRRSCEHAIALASKEGDSIVAVDMQSNLDESYRVSLNIKAIDRYHLLIDIVSKITNDLHLLIDSLTTKTSDDIVDCNVVFFVHNVEELIKTMNHLYSIPGIDEVVQVNLAGKAK